MTSMDDYFEPDALSSKLPFFENDPNMCFVSNLVKNTVDHNGKILDRKIPLIEWDQINGGDVERLIAGTHELVTLVALQGSMLRTRDILAIGGFDEDLLGDDVVLYTKLFFYMQERPELNFKMLDTVAINYRLHQNNISKNDLRMAEMTVEWRNRYFADRPIPNRLLLSLKLWVASTLIHKKPEQATGFIKHFRSLLKDETAKTKEQSIAFLLGATDKRCRYLIPFFFEVKKRKTILTSRFSFIFLGFKAAELISERYAGRSYTKIILFKYLNFTFLHKR